MKLHRSVYVAPDACVIGDVSIDEASSVWPCAVLRGDNQPIVIGRRCNIQDGSVLHCNLEGPLVLGDDVQIAHGVMLHSCTVEDGCLIGIGAIVLDGARIGTGSIVAAGSLVPPNMQVPPGSMVMGSPARFRRPTTPAEQAQILEDCGHYAHLAEKARQGGAPAAP